MLYEFWIADRHLRTRKKHSLSVVTWLAVIGVALGVAALVGGFSITSGFEQAFREKVLGITAHINVREYGIRFTSWPQVMATAQQVEGVRAVAPTTRNAAMISGRYGNAGVVIKGIDVKRAGQVLDLESYLTSGRLEDLGQIGEDGLEGIILGRELAERVGAQAGDVITLTSPLRSLDPDEWSAEPNAPTSQLLRVRGVFSSGFQEYDSHLSYMKLRSAQKFFGSGDAISEVEVAVHDPMQAGQVAARLEAALGEGEYAVRDWRRLNRNLFASLGYQRLAILVVISVTVILAACNVACMLIMIVLERTRDIAILKAMGMTSGGILRTFVLQGLAVGLLGTAIGMCLAYAFCEGLLANGISLDPKVYGISRLPVVFVPMDYVLAGCGAMVITLIAAFFPAMNGARMHTVDGLQETFG